MKKNFASLLFEWPIKKAPRLALPLFILLAVLLHLSTIYLFDIVYQAPRVSKPVAAQVLFLLPGSPASQQLTVWLQANDPAIFSPLRTLQINRLKITPDIYQPAQISPALHPLPSLAEETLKPPFLPTNETALPSSFFFNTSVPTPLPITSITRTTTIRLMEDLLSRMPTTSSSLGYPILPSEITTPLSPTTLRGSIDTMGIPRHVMIVQSSGNNAADEAATHWFMTRRFSPANHETWGSLLIFWGSEPLK